MRAWIYYKGSNNGEIRVGYRYDIGDDIKFLYINTTVSCETNAVQCGWQRIEVPLSSVLTNATEVIFI